MHLYVQNKKSIQFIFLVFARRQLKLILKTFLKTKMLNQFYDQIENDSWGIE